AGGGGGGEGGGGGDGRRRPEAGEGDGNTKEGTGQAAAEAAEAPAVPGAGEGLTARSRHFAGEFRPPTLPRSVANELPTVKNSIQGTVPAPSHPGEGLVPSPGRVNRRPSPGGQSRCHRQRPLRSRLTKGAERRRGRGRRARGSRKPRTPARPRTAGGASSRRFFSTASTLRPVLATTSPSGSTPTSPISSGGRGLGPRRGSSAATG